MKKRKNKNSKTKKFLKIIYYILASPYFLIKFIIRLVRSAKTKIEQEQIKIQREKIQPIFEDFKVLKKISGNYKSWFSSLLKPSGKIGIILGARGKGKTAWGIKILENLYAKSKQKCFVIGFEDKDLPAWITSITNLSQIQNNSTILIDEGGILFSSRKSMSSANKMLSDLILISRHKNLNILFISQNSSNLDINILRQADFLILKPSSLLQKDFERKIIQKLYNDLSPLFSKFSSDKGLCYIHSDLFQGFVSNPLPSFWKESISKSFKNKGL